MIAYFDCFSGVSGDMTLGALLSLGGDIQKLAADLAALPLDGFSVTSRTEKRMGISGTKVHVEALDPAASRNWTDIRDLLEKSPLPARPKARALSVFGRLAEAEARVHGVAPETVHFHEVGGVDAIVDIVGSCLLLEELQVDRVVASPIPLGSGFVKTAHGMLPVPAPATVELLTGVPAYGADTGFEMVTPTGAAIVSALAESFGPPPAMEISGTGYGVGSRELPDRPNALRVILGKPLGAETRDRVAVIETNVDDMNPEQYGLLMDRLFREGALDVSLTPLYMKKGRPGTLIRVIAPPALKEALARRVLMDSSAVGVRFHETERLKLPREAVTVETPLGPVAAKRITSPDGSTRVTPEHDACRALAEKTGRPIAEIYEAVVRSTRGNTIEKKGS